MAKDFAQIEAVAKKLGESLSSDIILLNAPIEEATFGSLVVTSAVNKQYEHALLILVTHGGSANSAYRIARYFQHQYKSFSVFTPSFCKSAGTLIAIGAHKLIMSTFAELGPLDVQLMKADEIWERRSGLIGRSALASLNEQTKDLFSDLMLDIKAKSRGSVRFKMAADLAVDLASKLLAPIYGQINPVSVGEDHRDLNVALEYGKRLCGASQNINETAIHRLVHAYPSHDFVIDREEAKGLFTTVEWASKELYELTGLLEELAYQPLPGSGVVRSLTKLEKAAAPAAVVANEPDVKGENDVERGDAEPEAGAAG